LDEEEQQDISAIVHMGSWIVLGADEGSDLAVLRRVKKKEHVYEKAGTISLLKEDALEIDIEGVARDGDYLYATGSHSLVRKTLKDDDAHSDNREKIARVEPPSGQNNVRDSVFRFTFDSTTGDMKGRPEQIDIKKSIHQDPVLARFADIPSKENGIDIEEHYTPDLPLLLVYLP